VDHIIRMYADAFEKYGYSKEAVLWPKGRQEERFEKLTQHINGASRFSLLDFGCGLAHLKPYLDAKFNDFAYTGADIVDVFIRENRTRYPDSTFKVIQSFEGISENYDYSVLSGTFNLLYQDSYEKQWLYIQEVLAHLFKHTTRCLSCDFMTDQVDFVQPGAYHQNVMKLYEFVSTKLSKRLILDQSYMPYEFSIHIFKNVEIKRPENIYTGLEGI